MATRSRSHPGELTVRNERELEMKLSIYDLQLMADDGGPAPIKSLKMLSRLVVDEPDCPIEVARTILQLTLKVLFAHRELDV